MNSAQAREEARRILSERRFHGTDVPRPFHGILSWLARHLHFVARWWHGLGVHVGGGDVLWGILAAVIVGLAVFLATRRTGGQAEDPTALERLAVEAERRGDLVIALRLRFRAGLLRLARRKALPERLSLRTGEARRALHSQRFDRLARDFDEVVYGRREPSPGDVAAARSEWPQVLEEVRR